MFRWRLKSSLFARDMKGSRRRKLLKLTLLLPLVASLVVGWFIYREAVKIHGTPLTSWQEDHSGDCAVVLTGGANRVHEGFALLAQKQVRKLIISGVFEGAKLEEIFPLLPFYGTIASKDVVLEKNSRTTFGNAQQSLALVEALKCRDVVLVTSYLHMRRALRTFDATFPDDIVLYPRATIGSGHPAALGELLLEASKSFFYSLWAYGPEKRPNET